MFSAAIPNAADLYEAVLQKFTRAGGRFNRTMFHRRGLFRPDRRFFRSESVRLPGRGVLNFRIGSTVFGRD
jgi:hypothetical protein